MLLHLFPHFQRRSVDQNISLLNALEIGIEGEPINNFYPLKSSAVKRGKKTLENSALRI